AVVEIIRAIRHLNQEVYRVADVAGLYSQGIIPREIAEADARPITPLVARPRPYHGWLVVAMEFGPSSTVREEATLLKGQTRNKDTFAFCIYPEDESRTDVKVWLICPFG